jgi:hypothetical protein
MWCARARRPPARACPSRCAACAGRQAARLGVARLLIAYCLGFAFSGQLFVAALLYGAFMPFKVYARR